MMRDRENEEVERLTMIYVEGTQEYAAEYKGKEQLYRCDNFHKELFVYPMLDFADDLKEFRSHVREDCGEHLALSTCLDVLNAIHLDLVGCSIPNIEPCEAKT